MFKDLFDNVREYFYGDSGRSKSGD